MEGIQEFMIGNRRYVAEVFQMAWPAVMESFFVAFAAYFFCYGLGGESGRRYRFKNRKSPFVYQEDIDKQYDKKYDTIMIKHKVKGDFQMKRRNQIVAVLMLALVMMMSSAMVSFAETGWVQRGNAWYYYSQDGTMAKNRWVITNGGQFWMNEDGTMATNKWINTEGLYYYVGPTGEAVTGWYEINGVWYYFYRTTDNNTFAMATDTQIDGYRIGKDGAWIQ